MEPPLGRWLGDDRVEDRPLTTRELEILRLLAEGYSRREIAERLDIRCPTVNCHIARIYRVLQVDNCIRAVNAARVQGRL